MSDTDPLADADVGETRSVEQTVTIHPADYAPAAWYGSDRTNSGIEVTDMQQVTTEYDEPAIEATFATELTRTDEEPTPHNADGARLRDRLATAVISVGIVSACVVGVGWLLATYGQPITLNGTTVDPSTFAAFTPLVLIVVAIGFGRAVVSDLVREYRSDDGGEL